MPEGVGLVATAKRLGFGEKYNPLLCNVPFEEWRSLIDKMHKESL